MSSLGSGSDMAVVADHVSKKFRLFKERNNSIKATVMRGRRSVVEDFWALKDVSFAVPVGSTTGLVGENGSGKSTMLKCLAKILRPDQGSVAVKGKMSALLELGAGFHPELSGRENVFLNGAILGLKQKELLKRFDSIVEFAGIGAFIDEPVKNYSSGMYVRLGFSVAINVDPEVLLVDEVLAVGDEAFQRKCNEKFAQLKREGKTIILVSHAMQAVSNMCDHVVWFEHGKLMAEGNARDVIERYTGSVQVDRKVQETESGERWGSGEARIERIELLDRDGRPTLRPRTGEPMTIRMYFCADEPIERPVFGVNIHTLHGFLVAGPNTREASGAPDKIDGEGFIDLELDRLALTPGTYDLSCSLHDYQVTHPYDMRRNVLRFDVERSGTYEPVGVVTLGGSWKLTTFA